MRSKMCLAVLLVVTLSGCREELARLDLPSLASEPDSAADPCAGQERCLVSYLAPWCPACKLTIPFLNNVRRQARARRIGVKVILGNDNPSHPSAVSRRIEGRVFFDPRGDFARAMKVRSLPSHWIVDDGGKIRDAFTGGLRSTGSPEQDFTMLAARFSSLDLPPVSAGGGAGPAAPPARALAPGTQTPPARRATATRRRLAADPDCGASRSGSQCRDCCARIASTGYVWIHGAGCRCPR